MATNEEILIKLKALDELTPVMLAALKAMETNSAKMADALDKVSESSKKTEENTHGLHGGLLSLHAGFELAKEGAEILHHAFEKVEAQFERAIEAALEAEKAQNQLTGAMVSNGLYTEKAVESLAKYTKETQEHTGIQGDLIKTQLAMGLQMGLNVKQTEEMQEAARKLAAVTGGDLNSAFAMLQGAMSGNTRGLGKVLPQVKELTEAQLKNGEANAIVSKALEAQYKLYEGSFAAGLQKAKTSVSEVYEEFGKIIIQSGVAKSAVALFTQSMTTLKDAIESTDHWIQAHSSELARLGDALVMTAKVAAVALGVWATAAALAAIPTMTLASAVALLSSPILITAAAVAALTAAFYKWPGLFDVLIGSLKTLVGTALLPFNALLSGMLIGVGALGDAMGLKWAKSVENAGKQMLALNASLIMSGAAQVKAGAASIAAGNATDRATASTHAHTNALNADLAATSAANKATLELQKTYDGFAIGTSKQRVELEAQVQGRAKDLKDFEGWLESKKRLAVTKAEEQAAELNKARAKELTGTGGGEEKKATSNAAVDAENAKQAQLDMLYKKGILDREQYNEATLASDRRAAAASLAFDQANAQATIDALGAGPAGYQARLALKTQFFDQEIAIARQKAADAGANQMQQDLLEKQMRTQFFADKLAMEKTYNEQQIVMAMQVSTAKAEALGESEAGLQLRMQNAEMQFQLELQQKMQHAQALGATEAEIQSMTENAQQGHLAAMSDMRAQFYQNQSQQADKAGDDWQASLDSVAAAYAKNQSVLDAIDAISRTKQFQGVMKGLSDVSNLRNSHSKTAFEIGKKAAVAEATVQTFLSATKAYASLAGIPFVGPALGIAAAAAAVASGFVQIQGIESQKFSAQAHGGMDSIPSSLNNSTFIMKAGERVVQPEANKDLTEFLSMQRIGQVSMPPNSSAAPATPGGAGGNMYSISLTYHAAPGASASNSQQEARAMAEMVVKEIRQMSERGTPVISAKGITS